MTSIQSRTASTGADTSTEPELEKLRSEVASLRTAVDPLADGRRNDRPEIT